MSFAGIRNCGVPAVLAVMIFTLLAPMAAMASGGSAPYHVPVYAVVPFVLLLLCIAIMPLKFPHFWESNAKKGIVVAILSVPIVGFYLYQNDVHRLLEHLHEYLSFIVLLWSLYTISGGIVLRGNLKASPAVNTAFLGIGALIANLFGTTGASMLLIRPLLRTNQEREFKVHTVVFFIFVVSNIGGCLTPLGDPPLYMGFMRGVPFQWTLSLWPQWLLVNSLLLVIYYMWDRIRYRQEKAENVAMDMTNAEPLRIDGKINIALILGVVATIALSGVLEMNPWLRDGILVALGLLSMATTKKKYREDNEFNFGAITEVAVLFIGIFITMIPALMMLSEAGPGLGVNHGWQYFWITGTLSSFLDNTPTYIVFLDLAQSTLGSSTIEAFMSHVEGPAILKAISLGAVFMGANTYIGNGPNFMVKAIAEAKGSSQVKMPSFGGYMVYSMLILVPIFLLVTLLTFVLGIM
ncbi:MAG TPA: sodium:proton antiporter [Myxococcota bacterium]|nr:sodium:proton antiporter [Myxococcota bacterium]HOC99915.1 sodium:proton antiporter [Myxococcota bacterium]HOH75845.1 sodium:proton antiporter [Myxococcota bacterium]